MGAYNAINKFTPPKKPLRAAPRRVAATANYDELLQALYEKNGSKPQASELRDALKDKGVKFRLTDVFNATNKFTPRKKPLRAAPRRVAATNNYDEVLQALFEKNWSKPSPRELIAALALEGIEINVQQATPAVRRFTPVKTLVNRPHEPTHPSIRALGLKLQQNKARHHQRRRMPAASTGNYVKRMQEKLMQKRAADRARTYGGQLEASRNAPRRTPSPQTSSAIKAIQMKLQQARAAILAKYPEYETWAEYEADMTPDMIRH